MYRLLFAGVLSAVLGLGSLGARAEDGSRGQLLYDFACDACHNKGVHQRASRKATNFPELRGFVVRWATELGTQWTDLEIDEVARFLNDKYYHFPCPAEICRMKSSVAN